MTAFIAERDSEAAARALADSYGRFLVTNGGTVKPQPTDIPGASVVQVFDTFEVFFTKGRYLLGVHDASQLEPAQHLGQRLYEAIPGSTP